MNKVLKIKKEKSLESTIRKSSINFKDFDQGIDILAFSSDANKIDELPEHEREQSKILRSSVICLEFIISDIVLGSLLYANGLSIACL